MNFKERQKMFDNEKWFDSIVAGEDRCGSYAFCSACDKEDRNPCVRAMDRHEKGYIRIATIYRKL